MKKLFCLIVIVMELVLLSVTPARPSFLNVPSISLSISSPAGQGMCSQEGLKK